MSLPQLSETSLRRNAGAQSFEQGKTCYESGAVVSLTQRGATLQAGSGSVNPAAPIGTYAD